MMEGAFPRQYSPQQFEPGQQVRIYTSHSTDTEVYIREGVVLSCVGRKRSFFGEDPALKLRVVRRGKIMRTEPRDVAAPNLQRYVVRGTAQMADTRQYTRSYYYRNITLAERIE